MFYDMSANTLGTQGDNPWQNGWSLVIHCNPNNQDAQAATKTQGMTVCGVALYTAAANSGSSGGSPGVRVFAPSGVSDGNYASGSLTWNSWAYGGSAPTVTGGLDVLHVYVKDNKVFCHYNLETGESPIATVGSSFVGYTAIDYEVLLLSSSTSYPLDGTRPMSITLTWQPRNNPTSSNEDDSTVRSDDQFRMYIDGQLEDSTSATRGTSIDGVTRGPTSASTNCQGTGGYSRANFAQFVIGAFDTNNGLGTGGAPAIGNITAEIGDTTTHPKSFNVAKYDNRINGFHGTIEEIILYPY